MSDKIAYAWLRVRTWIVFSILLPLVEFLLPSTMRRWYEQGCKAEAKRWEIALDLATVPDDPHPPGTHSPTRCAKCARAAGVILALGIAEFGSGIKAISSRMSR